jgi:hypothetical protein
VNLTEFLLARIAEDESMATALDNCPYADGIRDDWPHIDPSRVLAECEAKRLLVTELPRWDADVASGWDGIEEMVMCHLALPYAIHPDYDQAWRPR